MGFSASGGSLLTPKHKFLTPRFFGHGLIVLLMIMLYSFTYGQSSSCSYSGTPITVGTSCTYVDFDSNNSSDYWNSATGCNAADRDDAWWYFTATATSTTITYNPDSRDAILHLFTGSCSSSMTHLACADDAGSGGTETISAYPTTIGVQYAIRIQRYNSNNNMTGSICVWSPAGPPPCIVAPTTPINGAVDVSIQPTLEWPAAFGATGYDVYLGTSPTPSLVSSNQSGTTYTPSALLDEVALYYWMIVPKNAAGDAVGCSTWSFKTAEGGCLGAIYGQYPATTYTPTLTGSPEVITTAAYASEYSMVEVVSGYDYTFASSVSTDLITVSDDVGTTVIDYGLSSVTWSATSNSTVRFYCHKNGNCDAEAINRTRSVSAAAPCSPEIAPWIETFTTTVDPVCWTQSATTGGPWVYTGNPGYSVAGAVDHTSGSLNNYAWMDFSGTDVGVILTTPEIDVSGLSVPQLSFWMISHYTGTVSPYNLNYVEAFNGLGWVPVGVIQGETGPDWVEHTFDLTPFIYGANLVQVRFRAESGGSAQDYWNDLLLDDVAVKETPCGIEIAPWTEPFTTTVDPTCWTQAATTGGPWVYTGNPGYSVAGTVDHTSGSVNNYAWMDFSTTDVGVILTTPVIDVSALTTPQLRFWMVSHYTGSLDIYNFNYVEAWDGSAWQLVGTIQGETGPDWVEHTFDLSSFIYNTNFVQVRFRAESGGSTWDYWNDLLLDDVSVVEFTCATEYAPWTEPFTTTVDPTCWTQSATSGGPWVYTGNPGYDVAGTLDHTSGSVNNYAWMDFSGTDAGVILTTPVVNVSLLTVPELHFWLVSHFTGSLSPYNLLYVEAFDGVGWNPVGTIQGETGAGWVEHTFDLSSFVYAPNLVQVRFRAESGGSSSDFYNDLLLDDVSIIEQVPVPVNDECANATSLPCGTSALAGSTVNSVWETSPAGSTVSSYGIWYTFTGDGVPTTISADASFDHALVIMSGTCGSLTLVAEVDGFISGFPETYSFTPTNGVEYYVYIAHYQPGNTTTGTTAISRECFPPPANDECANATSLPCGTSGLAGTTVNTVIESSPGNFASDYGVWYTFTGNGLSTTISVTGINLDAEITFVEGNCSGTVIATVDADFTPTGTESYTFTPTNGVDYFVYVAYYLNTGTSSQTGDFTISRTCVTPPVNDECANATSLPCGTSALAGTTVNTVIESSPFNQASDYGVWYTFTGDGLYTTISTTGTGLNQEMTIVYGTCGSYSLEATVDASSSTTGTETYSFYPTNGVEYFVYVAYAINTGTSSQTGTFTISRDCPAAPANDACANATSLPCGTSGLAGTTVATVSETPPSTTSNYGVWYEFAGDGLTTTISSTAASGFDHEMTILSGSCGSLSVVSDVDGAGAGGTESYVFVSSVGTQYYVFVAHATIGSTTVNTFTISRTCTFPPPANDECANATSLPCGTSGLAGTTVNTIIESSPFNQASDYGVWYTFTGNGLYNTISTTGTGLNQEMTIVYGSCGSYSLEATVDASSSTTGTETYSFYPTNGVDYFVYVAYAINTGTSSQTGTFTISRDCFLPPPNDECNLATSLPCGTSGLAGTTQYSVPETPPSTTSDHGVWYTFTGDGLYTTISSVASGYDHEMTIGYGSCGSITVLADVDGAGSGGTETHSFYPTNGVDYFVFVAHATPGSSIQGSFTISRDCPSPPVNDECANATSLPCGTSGLAGTTVAAVAEAAPLGLSSDYGVWYTFTGDGVYTTISSTATSGYDHEMTILYGSCGSVTGEASVDGAGAGGTETYTFYPTNGVVYFVYISHATPGSTEVNTFTISRTCTAAPSNDECANATNLPCATSNLAGTTVATIAETPPSTTSDFGVWYEFTGDGQSTTISSVAASGFDHEMTILSGSCGGLTVLADVDGAGAGGTESHTFTTVLSTQYYVFVAHATPGSTTQNTFTISRTCTLPPPANDECSSATSLPCGTSGLAGTTDNTIVESSPGNFASDYGVWYTFTGDGVYTTISVTGINLDAEITFVEGSCGGAVIASVDLDMTATGTESYSFTPTLGTDYFVYVAYYLNTGTSSQTGDFTISRVCYPPPTNDECANATSLPCATTDLGGTTIGTVSESGPGGSDYGVWYTFTGDGLLTTISTTGVGMDQSMTIVYGSCGSYTLLTTVDASSSTTGTESVSFYPTNGVDYFVYVSYSVPPNNTTATGNFTISRVCYPIPANDECANATNLPCGTVDMDGTTIGAIPESAPSSSSSYGVWYEFTGADEATTISSVATFDHEMTILSGSCGGLTVIANVDSYMALGTETYTFHADAGTQYYVYVAHYSTTSGTMGTFDISRSCVLNDVCETATAFSLPCGGSYNDDASTAEATNTDNGGTCTTAASTANATWYSFTGTGYDVTASLCGSSYDTKIFIYSGTCGALVCETGNDDFSGCGMQSQVTFTSTYGTTYYIMVAGYSTYSGSYTLNVTDAGVLPTGVDAGSPTTICNDGSSTNLNGSYTTGSGILWSPATGLSSTTILDPVASPTATTIYTLTIGTGACESSSSVTISVDEPSVAPSSVSGPIGICLGTVAPLTVVGGTLQSGDWQWYEGSCGSTVIGTGTTINVSPSVTSFYYVQAPANGVCPATSCTSRTLFVTSPNGGLSTTNSTATCPMDQSGYIHLLDNSGNLLASVDPQGQNLGNVSATVYVETSPIVIDHCSAPGNPIYQVSVADRHWAIKTTVAPTGPVKVRLPISDIEVNSLNLQSFNNLNPDDQVGIIDDIHVTKYSGPNEDNDFFNNCAAQGGSGLFPLILQDAHGFVNSYIGVHPSDHRYIEYTVTSFSEFWMHGSVSGSGLPVEMVNFSANCIEPGVTEVSWETISEHNSSHFELLKSNDGHSWNVLAVVDAAGESQEPIYYSVTDEMRNDIDGIVYYRIEQFDHDGVSSNFNAVSVSCVSENSDLIVYPNPGSGDMNIRINEDTHIGSCSLLITDSKGKIVHHMDVEINKGDNALYLERGTLKPGVYFIKVYNEDYTTKTIKYIMTEN